MHPPVTAAQKEAMCQLRALLPPTFGRLAAIAGLHVTTVRDIASKENWPRQSFTKDTVMRPMSGKALREEAAARARDLALAEMTDQDGEAPPGDIAALVVAELRAMLAALRVGQIDKGRIDALMAMIKAAERVGDLPTESAQPGQQDQKRSDEELAGILERVDQRIIELARGYAERLGKGEHDA
jgi:hypothetical protein